MANARYDDNGKPSLFGQVYGTTDLVQAKFDSVGNLGVNVNTSMTSSTPDVTSVNDSLTNVTLKAANPSRKGLTITNDSSARLYIKLGATATTTSYTVTLAQYGYYEVPFGYTGIVDGIWAADPNDGGARVTELT